VTRPATREERQLAFLWLAAAVSAVALRPLWLALAPHLRACVFHSLTGIPCPTCGTTRTAVAMLHGDLAAAFAANPLAAAAGLLFVAGGWLAAIWAVAGWPAPVIPSQLSARARIAAVAVAAANWLYLITTT
jgi:hypothetical protein